MRCPESCKMKHQDIEFRTRRTHAIKTKEQDNGEIGKEPNMKSDYSPIFSTKRNSRNCQNNKNGTMR